jgi:hypothetical protein
MSKLDRTNGANLAMGAIGLLALGSVLGGDMSLFDALKGSGNKYRVWKLTKRKGRSPDVAFTISAKDGSSGRSVQGIVFRGGGVHWDYPDQVPKYIKEQANALKAIPPWPASRSWGWSGPSGSKAKGPVKPQARKNQLTKMKKGDLWKLALHHGLLKGEPQMDQVEKREWTKADLIGMIVRQEARLASGGKPWGPAGWPWDHSGSKAQTKWGTQSHKLSAKQRLALPLSDFVFPGDRRYPIYDKKHGELALTMATWTATSRKDLPKVKKAVFARYPSLIRWWNNSDYVKSHPRQVWRQRRKAA